MGYTMATGMLGADTEELRALALVFRDKQGVAETAQSVTVSEVEGVRWVGPDADLFRSSYQSTVAVNLGSLADELGRLADDLDRQAGEQDDASRSRGAGAAGGPAADGGYQKPWWRQGWQMYKNLVNIFKGPRFLMELGAALARPGVFGKFFTLGWEGITGFQPHGMPSVRGIEKMLDDIPGLGSVYKGLKNGSDLLQGNWFSKPLERSISSLIDSRFGREPFRVFQAGADGIDVLTRSATMDNIQSFVGKEGRAFGRVLGGVGIGMDLYDATQYASHGQTGQAVYSGVKAGLGAASFIPGPVGWAAAGASLGLAAYDNIPVVHNTVNAVGSAIKDTAKSLWPF